MATLLEQIAEKYLVELAECAEIDAKMIQGLRVLLASKSKLKTGDLERVFSPAPEDLP